MPFEQHDTDFAPREAGWRDLSAPVVTRCFIGEVWTDAPVVSVNDETKAVRIIWPPETNHHRELDAAHHHFDVTVPGSSR